MNQPEPSSPNVPLLRQTMDAILAHPELHEQRQWAAQTDCGTTYCFAGWACYLSGIQARQEDLNKYGGTTYTEHGERISTTAAALLGIDWGSADELFYGLNSTADLKHYVDQIAEHDRIVEPIERESDEVPF